MGRSEISSRVTARMRRPKVDRLTLMAVMGVMGEVGRLTLDLFLHGLGKRFAVGENFI